MKRALLLPGLCLAALVPADAQAQAAEPALEGKAATERIIGNTLVLSGTAPSVEGMAIVIYFDPDGRAASQLVKDGRPVDGERDEAAWSVDDQERLCVVEDGRTLRDRDCIGPLVTGDTVRSTPEEAFAGITVTLVSGNPHDL